MTPFEIIQIVLETLLGDTFGYLIAVIVVKSIEVLYKRRKFGGWTAEIRDTEGSVVALRPIGSKKMEQVLDDDHELAVFVKGLSSPYGWLNCDVVTVGRDIGLLIVDNKFKRVILNMSKNPPKEE